MPISSFYGLQTAMRGLLAQQRALDTTGHNIANASTQGYSRQEAVLAAAPATWIPQGAVQGGAGAHLGSGVDVQAYRRVRDTFLDLQYRAQATRLGEASARTEGLDRAELALAEPSDDGINKQLSEFWDAWSDLANSPDDAAARQSLVEKAGAVAEAFGIVDSQLKLVGEHAQAEYDALTAAGGEVETTAREIAALNDTIKRFVTAGDTPNDLMDQRDLLLDKLATLGTTSITSLPDGTVEVVFGGPGDPPMIDAAGYHAPALSNPGGRLGALRDLATVPGGVIDSYRQELGTVAQTLAGAVNTLHGTPFFTVNHAPPASYGAASLAVAVTPATVRADASGDKGANKIALAIAELRGKGPDSDYNKFIARVGSEVRESVRQEANAQALSDAVLDRRDSVSGVSLDEEMGNIVRFQRAYQASSRAMSTMDEMLDVLINRTGRVGL
ncbi:MAG: flagellar hook-associated protein FlgK [Solirubrobacteraceae bacterium]